MPSVIVIGNTRVQLPETFTASYLEGAGRAWQLGRADEAEALLREGIKWFGDSPELLFNYAKLAEKRQDWPEVKARWHAVQVRYPERWAGYIGEALALCHLDRLDEAEALLSEAMVRFPDEPQPLLDYARVAQLRRDWKEAIKRWREARMRFPDRVVSYVWEAWGLRQLGRLAEAELLLQEALVRFPTEPDIAFDLARVAVERRDPSEAAMRWKTARLRFPDTWFCYLGESRALREIGQLDDAEELVLEAMDRFPNELKLHSDFARISQMRGNWPETVRRWELVRQRFPSDVSGFIGGATAFREMNCLDEAEQLLHRAMDSFSPSPELSSIYADLATRRKDWLEALKRWEDALRQFPNDREIPARAFEARLRVLETGTLSDVATERSEPATSADAAAGSNENHSEATRDLLLDFESLGGMHLGCEFGLIQRRFGVEPLGLLRWAAIDFEELLAGLEAEFADVGLPENTRLTVEGSEYITRDNRFGLRIHTFISKDSITADVMLAQACRRLQFLARKIVEDLQRAAKILVFKLERRTLTEAELFALHDTLCRYGPNCLLYVRYADDAHPKGAVHTLRPGLMIGHVDHFGYSVEGEKLELAVDDWVSICSQAHKLWRHDSDIRFEESQKEELSV